jgi:DNA-binding HxlR family transcriptional regulator
MSNRFILGPDKTTMSHSSTAADADPVEQRAERIPFEIRDAISAFDGKTEQALVVTLVDEQLAFSEIEEELNLHSQQLTNAIDNLLSGGLIRKRSTDDPSSQYQAYYEVTEYGERFLDCLLSTLGTVDSGRRPEARLQQIRHIHNTGTDTPVEIEEYTPRDKVENSDMV